MCLSSARVTEYKYIQIKEAASENAKQPKRKKAIEY